MKIKNIIFIFILLACALKAGAIMAKDAAKPEESVIVLSKFLLGPTAYGHPSSVLKFNFAYKMDAAINSSATPSACVAQAIYHNIIKSSFCIFPLILCMLSVSEFPKAYSQAESWQAQFGNAEKIANEKHRGKVLFHLAWTLSIVTPILWALLDLGLKNYDQLHKQLLLFKGFISGLSDEEKKIVLEFFENNIDKLKDRVKEYNKEKQGTGSKAIRAGTHVFNCLLVLAVAAIWQNQCNAAFLENTDIYKTAKKISYIFTVCSIASALATLGILVWKDHSDSDEKRNQLLSEIEELMNIKGNKAHEF